MAHSNLAAKPAKPYPGFPLFAHATGRWAKKIRGKLHYFGRWDDPDAALNMYLDQRDALHAGRTPRLSSDGLTVHQLFNRFCEAKERQSDAGDITRQTFLDYHRTCQGVLAAFGKHRLVDDLASDDFEALRASFAKRLNPNTLGNEVQRVRVAFKYAYDAGLIDKPIRFGPTFKRPAKRILRAERQRKGARMFEARQLRRILKAAPQPLHAMILLGVNCGFGNHDCGTLPLSAVDLRGGWIDHPRPKTAIARRCPLWPETVAALRDAIDRRAKPHDPEKARLVFVTKYGGAWAKDVPTINPLSAEMRKLLCKLKLHRPGLGFYALRHTFETIAGGGRDQVAVNAIMGHVDNSMAGVYRERISDERLRQVVEVVRRWLFRRTTAVG
ncbi:MAG: tyrosine-type recombinase/integrase [Pirellulales bacterium]|nr:tyrosine-type recombinase/integrase [Pirellulales bacterium]